MAVDRRRAAAAGRIRASRTSRRASGRSLGAPARWRMAPAEGTRVTELAPSGEDLPCAAGRTTVRASDGVAWGAGPAAVPTRTAVTDLTTTDSIASHDAGMATTPSSAAMATRAAPQRQRTSARAMRRP
jgi:hypothetical protein